MIYVSLSEQEAQALIDIIDKEVRLNGAQSAIHFGPIAGKIVAAAKAKEEKNGDNTNS